MKFGPCNCKLVYCRHCLEQWMELKMSCPSCRLTSRITRNNNPIHDWEGGGVQGEGEQQQQEEEEEAPVSVGRKRKQPQAR